MSCFFIFVQQIMSCLKARNTANITCIGPVDVQRKKKQKQKLQVKVDHKYWHWLSRSASSMILEIPELLGSHIQFLYQKIIGQPQFLWTYWVKKKNSISMDRNKSSHVKFLITLSYDNFDYWLRKYVVYMNPIKESN